MRAAELHQAGKITPSTCNKENKLMLIEHVYLSLPHAHLSCILRGYTQYVQQAMEGDGSLYIEPIVWSIVEKARY